MRIKLTCVFVEDQRAEYDRLIAAGVTFTHQPTDVGTVSRCRFKRNQPKT